MCLPSASRVPDYDDEDGIEPHLFRHVRIMARLRFYSRKVRNGQDKSAYAAQFRTVKWQLLCHMSHCIFFVSETDKLKWPCPAGRPIEVAMHRGSTDFQGDAYENR